MDFRQKILDNQPYVYNTMLSNVSLVAENEIKIDGHNFPLSHDGYDKLRKLARVGKQFTNASERYVGEGTSVRVIDAMRSAISGSKDTALTVAIDKESNEIVNLEKAQTSFINAEAFADIAERIVERYDLDVEHTTVGHDGNVNLALKNPSQIVSLNDFFNFAEDESYHCGLSLDYELGNVGFANFLERIICTNGMSATLFEDELAVDSLHADSIARVFDYLDEASKTSFLGTQFAGTVKQASETPASVMEVLDARARLKKFSKGPTGDRKLESLFRYNEIWTAYENEVGLNLDDLTQRQLRTAKTPHSIWDVVNHTTWVASNADENDGFQLEDDQRSTLMNVAGKKLTENRWDLDNVVSSPSFNLN